MDQERYQKRQWTEIAAEAAQRVNFVSHGEKQAAYEELGVEYDLSPNHIRRMVRALTFTVELAPAHPDLSRALRMTTFKASEIIDRWHARDPEQAIAAAKRYVSGSLTLRALASEAAGEVATPKAPKVDFSALDTTSFSEAAWRKLRSAIGQKLMPIAAAALVSELSGIAAIVQDEHGSKKWAIIIVEPGSDSSSYIARRELDLGRALALSQIGITAAFALPSEANPDEFRKLLDAFGQRKVIIVEVGVVATYG